MNVILLNGQSINLKTIALRNSIKDLYQLLLHSRGQQSLAIFGNPGQLPSARFRRAVVGRQPVGC